LRYQTTMVLSVTASSQSEGFSPYPNLSGYQHSLTLLISANKKPLIPLLASRVVNQGASTKSLFPVVGKHPDSSRTISKKMREIKFSRFGRGLVLAEVADQLGGLF